MSNTPRTDELDYNQETQSYRIWDLSRELERELNSTNERMVELKHKQASLIAAINLCLTEYPSDRSSIYLAPIMEKLFSK